MRRRGRRTFFVDPLEQEGTQLRLAQRAPRHGVAGVAPPLPHDQERIVKRLREEEIERLGAVSHASARSAHACHDLLDQLVAGRVAKAARRPPALEVGHTTVRRVGAKRIGL